MAVHPQRAVVASGDQRGGLSLWDLSSSTPPHTWTGARQTISALCWQGVQLVSANRAGSVSWWQDGTLQHQDTPCRASINALQCGPGQQHLLAVSDDGALHRWTGAQHHHEAWKVHQGRATCLAVHPDGRVFTGSTDANLLCWDLQAETVHTWLGHVDTLTALAVSPDGQHIASTGSSGVLKVWCAQSGRILARAQQHEGAINTVLWQGDWLITGGDDFRLGVWRFASNTLSLHGWLQQHQRPILALAPHPTSPHVLSAGADRTLGVWDPTTAHPRAIHHAGSVRSLAFSNDGGQLISGARDGTIWIRDLSTGMRVHRLTGHPGGVQAVAVSTGAVPQIASTSTDGMVRLWHPSTGALQGVLKAHEQPITACAWSVDGAHLFTASRDHRVRVWARDSQTLQAEWTAHEHWVRAVCVHPNGETLLTGSYDGTIASWQWSTQTLQARGIPDPDATEARRPVTCLALLPGASQVVSGGVDGVLRVWSVKHGVLQWEIPAHKEGIVALAAHSHGVWSAGMDGRVCRWLWDGDAMVLDVCMQCPAPLDSLACLGELLAIGDRRGHTWLLHHPEQEPHRQVISTAGVTVSEE